MRIKISQLKSVIKEVMDPSSLPKSLQKRAASTPGGKVTNVDLANYVYKHSEKFFEGEELGELEVADLQHLTSVSDLVKLATGDIPGFIDAWNMLMEDGG